MADFYITDADGYLVQTGYVSNAIDAENQVKPGETLGLGKAPITIVTRPLSVLQIETKRQNNIVFKANLAIESLELNEAKLNLLAGSIVDLSRRLVARGVLDLADIPPSIIRIGRHWDDHINPILAARDAAIADGTLADDFNP